MIAEQPVELERIMSDLPEDKKAILVDFLHVVRNFEKVAVDEMSDTQIFRFLKSFEFVPKEALPAVRKSVEWRRSFNWNEIRNIDNELVTALLEFTKVGYYGEDFEGRPIKIVQPGDVDPGEILKKIPQDKTFHFQLANIERLVNIVMPHCANKYNKNIHMQVVIVDIKNVNFGRFMSNPRMLDLARARSSIFQENYPETTARTVIINAGTVFYAFFKIVSVFLRKKTLERIVIMKDDYLPELLKLTTLDKIPVSLGGTCPFEIDNFPNTFDGELSKSYQEKRLK